jgi:signal peptidase I
MTLRWFFSKSVREATDLCKQARKILNHQRDILAPQALDNITEAVDEAEEAIRKGLPPALLADKTDALKDAADKWFKPYRNSGIRENVEVFLVVVAVAMAFRTFILQPFKIPTGSMQPTLYGITSDPMQRAEGAMPGIAKRIWDGIVAGTFYHQVVAENDGLIVPWDENHVISAGVKMLGLFSRHQIRVLYRGQSVPVVRNLFFTPADVGYANLDRRIGLSPTKDAQGQYQFRKGEAVVRFQETSGDNLFVDRVTYNFRKPARGDIIIFATRGTAIEEQDEFYIKRLVALPGETVSIGDDSHLVIDGRRLDANEPGFENVYTIGSGFGEWRYRGHLNGNNLPGVRLFPDPAAKVTLRGDQYLAMGDNTANSSDSRMWGPVPTKNVIAKSFFVYWPIINRDGHRWGWAHR